MTNPINDIKEAFNMLFDLGKKIKLDIAFSKAKEWFKREWKK